MREKKIELSTGKRKIYNLCSIRENINDNSILGHPLFVLYQAEHLADISREIKKRIKEGWAEDRLFVFIDVNFEVEHFVNFAGFPETCQ